MDADKVIETLNAKFREELPEYYKRRIVFWQDEDKEFADLIPELTLENAKIVTLTGTNHFQVKYLLNMEDTTSNYVVYRPFAYKEYEENWLLDMEEYSDSFHADLVSVWMNEMNLPATPNLRDFVKNHRKFFNAKSRRQCIIKHNKAVTTEKQLKLLVLAEVTGSFTLSVLEMIRKVIIDELDEMRDGEIYKALNNYGLVEDFWEFVKQFTGYEEEDRSFSELLACIVMTAASRTLAPEHMVGLERYIHGTRESYCFDLVEEWIHSGDADVDRYEELVPTIERELNLHKRLEALQIEEIQETTILPCIDTIILNHLMNDVSHEIIDVDRIKQVTEKRRTTVWYWDYQRYYEALNQVALMKTFTVKHAGDFHCGNTKEIWDAYTSEYYKMDTYYRHFHILFKECMDRYNEQLADGLIHVKDCVEGLYVNGFLVKLGHNWTWASEDNLKDHGYVIDVPRQVDFYRQYIAPKVKKQRQYVIISDAFRYDLGKELAEQLKQEFTCDVNVTSMQAVFPTITKFGMAALLPHQKLSLDVKKVQGSDESIRVLADGASTESADREKVLRAANPDSVVIKASDLHGLKRAERNELVKGKQVVYIYHDKVDHASHADEKAICVACADAIQEIINLLKIIMFDFSGAHVYVTADHGFLYSYDPFTEMDKVSSRSGANQVVEYGRRYMVCKEGAAEDDMIPVKVFAGTSPLQGFAPKDNMRIKKSSRGINYVHGGISLQEMVVPVVEYHYYRNDNKKYLDNKDKYDAVPVEVSLLSTSRKISNMIFALDFFQRKPVGGNLLEGRYKIYFMDSNGNPVSDEQLLIADKTTTDEKERVFRLTFNLKSQKYISTEEYMLVIMSEDGLRVDKEPFRIDIPISMDTIEFF